MPRRRASTDDETDDVNYIDPDAVRTIITYRDTKNRPVVIPERVAYEADVVYRSHERHLSGESWQRIAETEGFPNAQAAKAAVNRYLEEARLLVRQESGQEMLRREIETLDYMQSQLWSFVTMGDRQSIETVLKLMTKRVEWLGLSQEGKDPTSNLHQTVIVSDGSYAAQLRDMAAKAEVVSGEAVTSTTSDSDTTKE